MGLWLLDGHAALAAATLERRLEQVGADSLLAAPLLSLLVEAQLARGDPVSAERAASSLAELAHHAGQATLDAEARLATGRARRAAGTDSIDDLEQALELLSRLERPYEAARGRLQLAHALADARPELALGEAKLALAAFDRLSAARDTDQAAELVCRLGGGPRPGPRRDGALTEREEEVLELLAAGLTNREIAERLFLSVKTVEHHEWQRTERSSQLARRPPSIPGGRSANAVLYTSSRPELASRGASCRCHEALPGPAVVGSQLVCATRLSRAWRFRALSGAVPAR